MQVTKKMKLALASVLAVCCFGTAIAGMALVSNNTALAADAQPGWRAERGGDGPLTYVGGGAKATGHTYALSMVDILSLPNHTGYFSIYYEGTTTPWNAWTLKNGNSPLTFDGWDKWSSSAASLTEFPAHTVLFQTSAGGQVGEFGGRNHTDGRNSAQGIENAPGAYSPTPENMEIHIGTGVDGDISYVKEYGEKKNKMAYQGTTTSLLDGLTVESFPDGCYLLIGFVHNSGSTDPGALGDVGRIYANNYTFKSTDTFDWENNKVTKDAELRLHGTDENVFAEGYQVEVNLNGHKLAKNQYEVTPAGADKNYVTVKVTKETLNDLDVDWYEANSVLSYRVLDKDGNPVGGAVMPFRMQFEAPPTLTSGADMVLTEKKPIEITFDYDGAADVLGAGLTVKSSLNNKLLDAEDLTKGTDYTVSKSEEGNTYTVTITQSYVDKIFATHQTRAFRLAFGRHRIDVIAYLDINSAAKGLRIHEGGDYVAGSLEQDDFYTSANIMKFAEATLSSRIFWEKPAPANEPITIEYGYIDPSVEWMMLSYMSTNKISEYFSNEIGVDQGNLLSQIFFGGDRHDFQKMFGWAPDDSSTNITFERATKMKNNVVTLVLGEKAEDSYMEINGQKLTQKLSVKQSDFPNGVYVGLFYNNQKQNHYETVNTNLNAVAITAPQEDSKYAMDLGKATDFELTLTNTSGNLEITDDRGTKLPATDFSYDGSTGKLTIKANYFSNRLFTKEGQLKIWDTTKKTGTAFKMTFKSSGLQASHVAFATAGSVGDTKFELGIDSVTGVIANETPLESSAYTFENGTVTIKSSAISSEAGIYEFIIQSGSKLYPCYVDVQAWADGIYKQGTVAKAGNGYKVTGSASYTQMEVYDFAGGYTFGISFDKINGYYQNGLGSAGGGKYTGVMLNFYDPYTGYTLAVGLYANYDDDAISTANGALYIDYKISNREGGVVATGRQSSVAAGEKNPSASGLQSLQIKENNGGLSITVAGGRAYTISASQLGGFNISASILTVSTSFAANDSEVTVTAYAGEVDVYAQQGGGSQGGGSQGGETPGGGTQGGGSQGGETPGGGTQGGGSQGGGEEEKGGCGSVIGGSFAVTLALLGAAVALITVLRKKSTK